MNEIFLTGHLGDNPEVKEFESGKKLATFRIATKDVYYNAKNEKVESTDWHMIKCWEHLAKVAEKYFKKGSKVTIKGKLKSDSYNDKDGNKKFVSFIVADLLDFYTKPEE